MEMWAGVECTHNRLGDAYHDQLERTGHARRPADLEAIAALGVTAVRYPLIWERTARSPEGDEDWSWADARLGRLRELGIRPILGLVHHGSGPRWAPIDGPQFAAGLARFAARVAGRYPWVDAYTPVNEPLTTARFAGLYGHWFPHGRTDAMFARCLVSQCRAVVLAMQAIRRVRPDAQLVQTEDLGEVHAAPSLGEQAAFENERRWLSWDLLCGRVDRDHPLGGELLGAGIDAGDLDWFREHPCRPDILGVNHYVTSDRYLDDRIERYPEALRGGNGRVAYVDVEAVRTVAGPRPGLAGLLKAAWDRFGLPSAVTEAHLAGPREEQLRWLWSCWRAASEARAAGVDVRAVTSWSLFGAYDWDSLVTRIEGRYEVGAFDGRREPPRPTAVARLVVDLAQGRMPDHPLVPGPGWWERPGRLLFAMASPAAAAIADDTPPVLIAGGAGTLGREFARACLGRGMKAVALARHELDLVDPAAVAAVLERERPWAVINAAGSARVDEAEAESGRCRRENVTAAANLAAACARLDLRLVTFSTDQVFDGRSCRPYRESEPPAPLNVFGASKAEAERLVMAAHPGALVARISPVFGPGERQSFVHRCLSSLRGGRAFAAAADVTVSPCYLPDLVEAVLDLLVDGERGLWHLANPDAVTWADLAIAAARRADLDCSRIQIRPAVELGWRAVRPRYSALASDRGALLTPLGPCLDRFVAAWSCEPIRV